MPPAGLVTPQMLSQGTPGSNRGGCRVAPHRLRVAAAVVLSFLRGPRRFPGTFFAQCQQKRAWEGGRAVCPPFGVPASGSSPPARGQAACQERGCSTLGDGDISVGAAARPPPPQEAMAFLAGEPFRSGVGALGSSSASGTWPLRDEGKFPGDRGECGTRAPSPLSKGWL